MKRVLVTGCSGFLAPFLIDGLLKEGEVELFGLTEVADFRSDKLKVFHVDIVDKEQVDAAIRAIRPEMIFHLAAVSNVKFSWEAPDLTYKVNFIGSVHLLDAVARFSPACRVVLMSSAEVYGKTSRETIDEQTGISIETPYSLSKYAMEKAAEFYMKSKKLDITRIRSFNFIGPGQQGKFVASDFASQIAAVEKGKQAPVIRVGNLTAVRDFSDVRDIARYLRVIARAPGTGAIYNLASGIPHSIADILDILLSLSAQQIAVEVDQQKMRPVDVPRLVGDCSLIRQKFNLHPEYRIEQTLLDILDFWRSAV